MADVAHGKIIEYVSPRPLILLACFLWGVGTGFAFNLFGASEPQTPAAQQSKTTPTGPVPAHTSDIERRRQDIPSLAEVEPAQVQTLPTRLTVEDIDIPAPPVSLSTDGGLTGRTVLARSTAVPAATPQPAVPAWIGGPPLPDLNP